MLLIVGGAGFVGSNILATLSESMSMPIVVCDDIDKEGIKWKNLRGHRIDDIIKPQWLDTWLEQHINPLQVIIFAASSDEKNNPEKSLRVHYHLPRMLWEKATEHQKRFFYFSSWETYGDGRQGFIDDEAPSYLASLKPLHPRAWAQNQFDYFAASQQVNGTTPAQWIGLKMFDGFGPNEYHKKEDTSDVLKIFTMLRKNKTVTLPRSPRHDVNHGDFLRNRIWIGDCVATVSWLLAEPHINGIFNLAGPHERSFNDLANFIAVALDIPLEISYVQDQNFNKNTPIFNKANNNKLYQQHGYKAKQTSLEDGVNLYLYNYLMAASMFR